MRVIIIIIFFLQVSSISAQNQSTITLSLGEALKIAEQNNDDLSTAKHLRNEVKAAWYTWLFSIVKCQIVNEYLLAISDLDRQAVLHYQSGDTDAYQTSSLVTKFAEIETWATVAENETAINKAALCKLLRIGDIGAPSDTSISIYEIDKGYIDPSISGQHADSITSAGDIIRSKTMDIKGLELDNLFIRLQYFRNYALKHSETTIKTATAALRLEEIDYTDYFYKLSEAFQIRLDYIELLDNYNQKAIQLEYYAY